MEYFKLLPFAIFLYFNFILNLNCFGPKPANFVSPSLNNEPANAESQKSINKQLIGSNSSSLNEPVAKIDVVNRQGSLEKTNNTTQNKINNPTQKMDKINKSSYSNYIRVKTVYELAMETNPSMFFPHDEFETVKEYKERVSGQVGLMKEIVQITTQKYEIKKAKRLQVAIEKEQKRRAIVETLMSESSSSVEFKPDDIGRYDAENETFPIVLHDTQYQIFVPREEARTFKSNFEKVKVKGLKQLKPKYDVMIKVPKAHVRSRPNGSIIGIASNFNQFEHIQDVDEWYKINYKGQFGFTHKNNADLKIVDIDNEYEFYDLVAIHPNTGSIYAMTSVDKLVKAPLNLASRKYESGQPDGPKDY